MNPLLKFIVFVVVGPILMGLLYFAVMRPVVTGVTRGMTEDMQRRSKTVTARAQSQQAAAAQATTDARRAKLEADAAQARDDMAAAQIEREAAARKEAAWHTFFKPKKACDSPPDWDTQVECGNAHMRAKRDFEERWGRGEIR